MGGARDGGGSRATAALEAVWTALLSAYAPAVGPGTVWRMCMDLTLPADSILPAMAADVPLNDGSQAVDVLDGPGTGRVPQGFESRWMRWVLARAVAVLLLVPAVAG